MPKAYAQLTVEYVGTLSKNQPSHAMSPFVMREVYTDKEGGQLLAGPVEVDVRPLRGFAEKRVTTDRAPDLSLELAWRNIIAEEFVVCIHQSLHNSICSTPLTAVEASRPLNPAFVTMTHSTANTSSVAPHHLTEVAPGVVIVRIVIRVLCLFFVPAVGSSTSKLDPLIVITRRWLNRGEVATGTMLKNLLCGT